MGYAAITLEGGLFPADLIEEIAQGTAKGQRDGDFGLPAGVRLSDEIERAFSEIRTHWDSFQARLARSAAGATTLTREAWIIPVFETLGVTLEYQRAAQQVGTDTFVISHRAGTDPAAPPVHVVALHQSLDHRSEGSRRGPHATVQEFLNRTDAVWGIVTNGEHLRLLRDAQALARPAYVDFDLRAMVEGNLYSEFVVLYRLLQASRWAVPATEDGTWLEYYYQHGIAVGGRVREHLRDGVEEALKRLGTAFLAHPESGELRSALENSTLDASGFYREMLRLIYRFLFLMVVEERKLLRAEAGVGNAQEALARQAVYTQYYSLARLRERCEKRFENDGFSDLWEGLKQTFLIFREQERADALGLAALNGELFGPHACTHLESAGCANVDLLTAIFHLSTFREKGQPRRRVNYDALDVEELGSVYESLLDYHPLVELLPAPRFDLITGSERKQTGSYYTPPSLVAELIKSALVPVMQERLAGAESWQEKETALLELRVADPASGSGHFLLAAARAIAVELARVRNEGNEPSPESHRQALRDVIRSCIYAVDKNPLAVDLCKVALWIEGYNAGMPLSFLDHHIKHGDSLVGVFDPAVLETGIPDEAYTPVSGDNKAIAAGLKKRNKQERSGQMGLFDAPHLDPSALAAGMRRLNLAEERTAYDVKRKEDAYRQWHDGEERWQAAMACNLWTAAFFVPLQPAAGGEETIPTTGTVRAALANRGTVARFEGLATGIAAARSFFHWPLEFPDVMAAGGFDVVLGNPPWERIKLQEEEFFAARDPEIAHAANKAARGRLIASLPERDPGLAREFEEARHEAEAASKFIRGSGRFPLCGRGDVNTYSVFAELNRSLVRSGGRAGCIVPTGIATDDTTKDFFRMLMDSRSLASLYDFENRRDIFPGVGHGRFKFSLLTMTHGEEGEGGGAQFAFFLLDSDELRDPDKTFVLSAADMALLNPNTRTCPIFRTRRDAEITKAIYRRVPVLIDEHDPDGNPWGIRFLAMFHMSNDSGLFRTRAELEGEGWTLQGNVFERGGDRYLPLYEAKMVHQFDHRWATYDGIESRDMLLAEKQDSRCLALSRYWVQEHEVQDRLKGRWDRGWLLGWRDITNSTNERTVIAGLVPRDGIGNKIPLMLGMQVTATQIACLNACLNSLVLDYAARQKLGGTTLNYFIYKQLPIVPPETFSAGSTWPLHDKLQDWIAERVLELVYTAHDLQPFARDLGYHGPPFAWDEERRFLLRCELDAAFFHLYGIERDDVAYMMDTFPIVKRKDEAAHGEYRTKRVILEIYDQMAAAARTGTTFARAAVPGTNSSAHAAQGE